MIDHIVAHARSKEKKSMGLGDSAEHSDLDSSLNIIHMLLAASKDCMIFARVDDPFKSKKQNLDIMAVPTGKIIVYHIEANISKEIFNKLPQYDLYLRYEQVHHELNNIFAQFSDDKCTPKAKYLYVCGYYDNTIKIFDIGQKDVKPGKHLVHKLRTHNARVTCIKFSNDCRFLITCDADGIIHHYERNCHTDSASMDKASNTTVG
jgi:WD40 repeat protein